MPEEQFMNVRENAVLYDAILCGRNVPALYPTAQWFGSYAAMALANELAFFNIRNEAMVGSPYCNMDSIDKMTFPFQVASIGVQWFGMPSVGKPTPNPWGESDEQAEAAGLLLWVQELAKHCSLILKINQDEKIVLNCTMAPSGYGVAGDVDISSPSSYASVFSTWGNGDKELTNRWKFPVPLDIPRNQTISCKLEFSSIGKRILSAMMGPGQLVAKDNEMGQFETPAYLPTVIDSVVGVRVSLEGHRFVQQRGALHV
jgi:hypothetical protein